MPSTKVGTLRNVVIHRSVRMSCLSVCLMLLSKNGAFGFYVHNASIARYMMLWPCDRLSQVVEFCRNRQLIQLFLGTNATASLSYRLQCGECETRYVQNKDIFLWNFVPTLVIPRNTAIYSYVSIMSGVSLCKSTDVVINSLMAHPVYWHNTINSTNI